MEGLRINTTARPTRILDLSRAELTMLKERAEASSADKIELLRVIDTLLSSRLPDTDDSRPIVNLMAYKYALENNKDTLESIRSVVLRELDGFMEAAQAGGRRKKGTKRRRRSRTRRHR